MTAIKGTNGNDILVGTAHADRITPLLGFDDVDGGGGVDTLLVDYSSIANGGSSYSWIFSDGASFHGHALAGDSSASVTFGRVERISAVFDGGDNFVVVQAAALDQGARLDLDGGAGVDRLIIDFSSLVGGTIFEVEQDGRLNSNRGDFAGFESFEITLGTGNNQVTTGAGGDYVIDFGSQSIVNTSAGDDQIVAVLGQQTADGGDGYDVWHGVYEDAQDALSFTFDGSVASLSNGSTVANVEEISIVTGAGDDLYTITGAGYLFLEAGAGFDSLEADFLGGSTEPDHAVIGSSVEGELHGSLPADFRVSFGGFETVNYVAGDGDSYVEMYLQGMVSGGQLTVDGALGYDGAFLVLWPESDDDFVIDQGIVTSDFGVTLLNFEEFTLWSGLGDDSFSVTGDAFGQVDGGAGFDSISFDYTGLVANASVEVFGSSGDFQGWLASENAWVGFDGFETVAVSTGGGSDRFVIGALEEAPGGSIALDAGGGRDALDLNLLWFGDVVFEVDGGGFISSNTGSSFAGFEDFTIWLGDSNNFVTTGGGDDRIYSFFGGTSVINTGAGSDRIESWLSADIVDGGEGYDSWIGDYGSVSEGMAFELADNEGTLSNGTIVANVEDFRVMTGSGNDFFSISSLAQLDLRAGAGFDLLVADFATAAGGMDASVVTAHADGTLSGSLFQSSSFSEFEEIALSAGSGDSVITLNGPVDAGQYVYLDGGMGTDRLNISVSGDFPVFFEVSDDGIVDSNLGVELENFENYSLFLGSGDDFILAGAGNDGIQGGGGNDELAGGAGNDNISGGSGDDIIHGGEGFDVLSGGAGADIFVFADLAESFPTDIIFDFSSAEGDILDLSGIDADSTTSGNQAFSFIGSNAFSGTAGELQAAIVSGNLIVQGDVDGDGIADLWLNVFGPSEMAASDFFL